jgi:hypothetical protein
MQGEAWVHLFQRVPTAYHEGLYLVTMTGAEIIVSSVVTLEDDYVVLRGRSSGSTDAGRVFLMPYDQIDYAGFTQRMTEPEVKAIFGDGPPPVGGPALPAADEAVLAADPLPAPAAAAPAAAEQMPKKPQLSKSILLARLRSRLGQDSKPAP